MPKRSTNVSNNDRHPELEGQGQPYGAEDQALREVEVVHASDLAGAPASQEAVAPKPTVISAVELARETPTDGPLLASRRIAIKEKALVRAVTSQMVAALVHWHSTGGADDRTIMLLQCNGAGCVLCGAGNDAKTYLFVPLYFLMDGALGVISFAKNGGPGSLRAQLVPLLGRDDATDLIIEIDRKNRSRYLAKLVKKIDDSDGVDYGDDVLADVVARGGVSPEDVLGTVDKLTNEELLEEFPQLATVLAAKRTK